MYESYVLKDEALLQRIENALLDSYFTNYDQSFLETETGREDIKANVFRRYNNALKHVVPWVANQIDLQNKTVAEIGCGTGASTAAFAHFVQKIDGYDIDRKAIDGARARMEVMGFENVSLHLVTPEELIDKLKENHSDGVDIILLFAVLEHQTIQERHETISLCWELLRPDGLLVVTETPNLLHYTDLHTSLLPFLHLLPPELYARYADRSPREGFSSNFKNFTALSLEELDTSIMRWGRGVSYHDFELAMGKDYGRYLVTDGFEEEMLSWFEISLEEELLRHFFLAKELDVPLAFSRVVLNVIFKKRENIKKETTVIPENRFVADRQTVIKQESHIIALRTDLAAREQHLQEVLSSKRWRIATLLTSPYRKVKNLFS